MIYNLGRLSNSSSRRGKSWCVCLRPGELVKTICLPLANEWSVLDTLSTYIDTCILFLEDRGVGGEMLEGCKLLLLLARY